MTEEPEESDAELHERYRQASRAENAAPFAAARAAILAEGRRIAALRSQTPASRGVDTNRPANQPRWRLAAVGSLGAAAIAALLILPRFWEPPHRLAAVHAEPRGKAAPPDRRPNTAELAAGDHVGAPPATAQMQAAPSADYAAPPAAIGGSVSRAKTLRAGDEVSLLSAVSSGDTNQAARLLDQGADVRQADSLGRTPLLLAVMLRRADLVRLLLTHGADPNAPDHAGETPLSRARRSNAEDLVFQLESAGAR